MTSDGDALLTPLVAKVRKTDHSAKAGEAPEAVRLPEPSGEQDRATSADAYKLEDQVGFMLRQASQRHLALFADCVGEGLTPPQWSVLVKLQDGPVSQNLLGRQAAMDVATVKGVIDRLARRGLIEAHADPADGRRLLLSPTCAGRQLFVRCLPKAVKLSEETLAPLTARERAGFLNLLRKLR